MRKTFLSITAVLTVLGLLFNGLALPLLPGVTTVAAASQPALVTFESGAPAGFFVYDNAGNTTVATSTLTVSGTDPMARPGQVGDNKVLSVTHKINGWGGVGDDFSVAGDTGPQDWSLQAGFQLWFYGSNSGQTYQIDIMDNRSNPSTDTSERFSYQFVDTISGWRFLRIPFSSFARGAYQPNGAPNDGLTLTEMWGWALVLPSTNGAQYTVAIDDIGVYTPVVDDFEHGLPAGKDANNVNVGFSTFQGAGSSVAIATAATPPAPVLPAVGLPNQAMQVDVNVSSYAGFIHSFTNAGVNTWVSQNWSAYEGFQLWVYGLNSGAGLFIDILENRNPGSVKDDAERWTVSFKDDFSGWKQFRFPFASFVRKDVGNGAPNDGLTLTEVYGWAFGTLGTGGARTFYLDDAGLYGVAPFIPLKVTFTSINNSVKEGATAGLKVKLNRPMGDKDPAQVAVNYSVEPGSAVPGRNYTPVANGTLTFTNGGAAEQSIQVPTLRDYKRMGDLTVVARLADPVNAKLGATIETALSIQDAEAYDANLLDDFESAPYLWKTSGDAVKLSSQEVPAGSALALPDQQAPFEHVLDVTTPRNVTIIIRPGEGTNGNIGCPKGNGVIPVAVLSTANFDATTIDANTIRFGSAAEAHLDKNTGQAIRHVEDVNQDGKLDMVFHFIFKDTGYACNAAAVLLTGKTQSGQAILSSGQGSIRRDFAMPQDWSGSDGLSFWWYGQNTGDTFKVALKDNRAPDGGPIAWKLAWSDEFNSAAGTSPNPQYWSPETGDGIYNANAGWGNSELEYYTNNPENVSTDGQGNLVITTRPASSALPCYYGPCQYTSARLKTADKFEFGYGRAEARIQVPAGTGLWPAFWSLGNDIGNVGWPQSGEIDIMEVVGRQPQTAFGTIHGPGYSGGQSIGGSINLPSGNYADGFHTFAIEWQPNEIRWYMDGVQYFKATPADIRGNQWVYDHPFFLMLNSAIGGNFGGPVGADVTLPQQMKIDYVRVYQGVDTAERFETTLTDNFSGWKKITLPFSAFTRSAYQPADAPNDGLTLSEVWGYGIELPGGGTATGDFKLDQVRLNQATHLTVKNANDSGKDSLRAALSGIAAGGIITFDPALAGQTINLASTLTLNKDVTIDASDAPGLALSGGGVNRVFIINAGISANLKGLTVTNGYGWQLAGGILNNGSLKLDHVTVRKNVVATDAQDWWQGGGGIYVGAGGVLNLTSSTVSDNTAGPANGGGILAMQNTTISIESSTISGNSAGNVAGAFRNMGSATILNSTLSGNRASGWHGGAIFFTDGSLSLSYTTVSDNAGPGYANSAIFIGSYSAAIPTFSIDNSLITGNPGYGCEHWSAGTVALVSGGHNLVQDATCLPDTPASTDLVTSTAQVAPLADNGGPTLTHALIDGSQAIDAADDALCPATDQRGVARPQGAHCDIGAVEK